ncbi:MAG: DUF2344 domain-containing protein [Lachnospiraceae bacterium]|nr:DUF2344 domain-containing protein [Lachnospiraceae bacterium]
MKIRIKFSKTGTMKFIGHLDIMRYFQKAMRRSEVDIAYSEGFSPHQKMSFAAPLGVGLTSSGEYFDIEVHSTDSSAEMIRRINETMADGMEVLSYVQLPEDSKNAMSLVAAADYEVTFWKGRQPVPDVCQCFSEFCSQQGIEILKKTKKSQQLVDIKPLILESGCSQHHEEYPVIFMKLSAGSVNNLKPELVMQAFYAFIGSEFDPFAIEVKRLELYGAAESGLKPLESFGTVIE